uniref:Rho GTPase-activating protein 7-like n=1 Tax=Cicer arietinum TaxID=3827 RepID=A0A3Q7XMA3_CICAR|nr:rho GTPase-activating protein 7-like [Cicer arietinum]
MTASAVAACMAPLLLRPPLLVGECELEDEFDGSGDSSAQLLAVANAANNTQDIKSLSVFHTMLLRHAAMVICPCDSKSTEASTSLSVDELGIVDSGSLPSTSRAAEVTDYTRHPSVASSTLVELTTRLDFFKKRRSQLMEQLHNLDLNYGSTNSQDFVYKPSSPSWS